MLVELKNISKSFGSLNVIDRVSLSVGKKEIVCLVGPSGCGKSTILKIIGNLDKPDKGKVKRNYRKRSFIFQEPRLIPWFSVEKNIEIVLKEEIINKDERKLAVDKILKTVHLDRFKKYYPDQLSGGMKQRVAIARALVIKIDLLLMDEPFANIDFPLRLMLIRFLDKILSDNISGVYVTHDTREAVLICDRIYVLTSRPSAIKKVYKISVPRKERTLEILKISDEITNLLTEEYKGVI